MNVYNYHNIPGNEDHNKHLDLPLPAKCTMPELLNTFFCSLSSPSALGVPPWSLEWMSGADKHAAPTLKALAGNVQESSSMLNVDIYCQRQLVFLIHLYLPISPSLSLSAFFSNNPFGLVYCFHLPTDPNVPHGIPSLCSVEIFVSSSPLQHPLLLLCCPLSIPIPS